MAERPEDFNLPISVVTRLLKESLPENVAVSKEARAALAKAASIFVLYSTSLSNNFANKSMKYIYHIKYNLWLLALIQQFSK